VELVLFYEALKENHESLSFPTVNQIKKIWNEHGRRYNETRSVKDVNNVRADYRRTGHNAVVEEIRLIRVKQDRGELVSNKEIDLLATYDDLYYVFNQINSLPDGVMSRENKEVYLRKVKESIDSGIPLNFTAFEKRMKARRSEAAEMYAEIDEEIDSGLYRSIEEQIENAFGARKEEVQLSEYEKEQCSLGLR